MCQSHPSAWIVHNRTKHRVDFSEAARETQLDEISSCPDLLMRRHVTWIKNKRLLRTSQDELTDAIIRLPDCLDKHDWIVGDNTDVYVGRGRDMRSLGPSTQSSLGSAPEAVAT